MDSNILGVGERLRLLGVVNTPPSGAPYRLNATVRGAISNGQ